MAKRNLTRAKYIVLMSSGSPSPKPHGKPMAKGNRVEADALWVGSKLIGDRGRNQNVHLRTRAFKGYTKGECE